MGWHAFRSCNSKKDGTFYRNDDWGLDLLFLEPMSRKGSQITRIATVSCHIPADHSHAARRLSLPMATLQSEICICVSRIKQAYECHFPLFKIFFFLTAISQNQCKAHRHNFALFLPFQRNWPNSFKHLFQHLSLFSQRWISCQKMRCVSVVFLRRYSLVLSFCFNFFFFKVVLLTLT